MGTGQTTEPPARILRAEMAARAERERIADWMDGYAREILASGADSRIAQAVMYSADCIRRDELT